jgi:glucokinase
MALRDHSLQVWSALVVSLIHAYDPELIILGGGVMGSAQIIIPAILEYVHRHAHTPWGKVRIIPAQTGDDAALLAAPWLLQQSLIE